MKKKLLVLAIALICFSSCGCDLESNNFPEMNRQEYLELMKESQLALVKSSIQDIAAFQSEIDLVSSTIEKNVSFKATFLYNDFTGKRTVALPVFKGHLRYINNHEYREMFGATLTKWILTTLQDESLSIGDNGNIIGVILSWEHTDFWGNERHYSVCDFDGDGNWDYLSACDNSPAMSFTRNIQHNGIGREIDQCSEIGLSSSTEIISLQDLNETTTFKKLEKLL